MLLSILIVVTFDLIISVSGARESGHRCDSKVCLDGSIDAATKEFIFRGNIIYSISNEMSPTTIVVEDTDDQLNSLALAAFMWRGVSWVIVDAVPGLKIVMGPEFRDYYKLTIVWPSGPGFIDGAVEEPTDGKLMIFSGTKVYFGSIEDGEQSPEPTKKLTLTEAGEIMSMYPNAWNYMDAAVGVTNGNILFFKNDFHTVHRPSDPKGPVDQEIPREKIIFSPGTCWLCSDQFYADAVRGKTGIIAELDTRAKFEEMKRLNTPTRNSRSGYQVIVAKNPNQSVPPVSGAEKGTNGYKTNTGLIVGLAILGVALIVAIGLVAYGCKNQQPKVEPQPRESQTDSGEQEIEPI